jgi:hypothetical protein
MPEKPKRMTPRPETLRELFLKSGNLCAFPNCTALMMNVDGVFIGQICHIEAAEPGGERFNWSMTNEERRAASNLMLMCYPHHQVTNDVEKFSVASLREMKRDHEQRFARPDRAMLERMTDWTRADEPTHVTNLARFEKVLETRYSDEERADAVAAFNSYIDRFSLVPIEVREFVARVAQRIHRMSNSRAVRTDASGESILISDVKDAFRIGDSVIKKRLTQMESYGVGDLDEMNTDLGPQPMIRIWSPGDYAPSWLDIVIFCDKTTTPLESFTDDLRFSLLDSEPDSDA